MGSRRATQSRPSGELAARFTVARETVRQALRDLLVEGRIERRGRGTVVASPKLVQPLSIRSYTEGALSAGRVPSRKVVTFERMSADDGLATELGIEPGDSVVHLERVLFADGEKIGLESTFLPDSRFGEMLDAFDATTSLYAAVRSIGVVFASATERNRDGARFTAGGNARRVHDLDADASAAPDVCRPGWCADRAGSLALSRRPHCLLDDVAGVIAVDSIRSRV